MSIFQTIATGDLKDVVLSNDGKTAYLSNTEGWVTAFDVATGDLAGRWKVGTSLGGMDISQDGRYLAVAEQTMVVTSSNYDYSAILTVHVLDLTTGDIHDYKVEKGGGPQPFYDAVFTSTGKILLSGDYYAKVLTELDPSTGAFQSISNNDGGTLSASRDGSKIISAPGNSSDMPIYLYEAGKGITLGHGNYQDGVIGYNSGFQAISPAGDLIIQHGNIYDGALKFKGALATFQKEQIFSAGAAFSPDGTSLYVLDQSSAQILQLSTADWSIQKAMDSGLGQGSYSWNLVSGGAYGDRLTVSADGKHLVVLGDKALNVIDLTTVSASGGSDKADTLVGDASDNTLRGYGGDDALNGGGGNDVLYGGLGDDRLVGGDGADTLDGGAGADTADYSSAAGALTVTLTSTYMQDTGSAGKDTLTGIENLIGGASGDTLSGSSAANRLDGGGEADVLRGDAGADTLIGGTGDDILQGGGDDDALVGGDGFDIVSYEAAIAGVQIDLTKVGVMQNTHGDGFDSLSGIEGLKGSAFADVFIGSAQNESFEGGAGNDIIDGGSGVDTARFAAASNNFSWTYNENGSWTVRDQRVAGGLGVDTLVNVETLQFTDKSVALNPSNASVSLNDLVGVRSVDTIAAGQIIDAVLSPDGRTAYVSNNEGVITALNTATGGIVGQWTLGGSPGGMDLSNDGRFLVVADRATYDVTGSQWDTKATAKIHLLDLSTGKVTDYSTAISGYEMGFYDAAFTSDNKVMFTQAGNGDAGSQIRALTSLDLATGAFSRQSQSFGEFGVLVTTDDHGKLLFNTTGISDVPLYLYTAGVGQTAFHGNYADGVSSYGLGTTAIAGNGSFVAQYSGALHVYDGALKYIANLSTAHPEIGSGVFGMDFSADGSRLFVVDATTDRIFEFSTSSWLVQRVYSLGVDIGLSASGYYTSLFGDRVQVSADGSHILIASDQSVVSVNLATIVPSGGSDGADVITGGAGGDFIDGAGGDDVLSGERGDDILWGGAGRDSITGGADFDQINGNLGDDTAHGGEGGDWVVGGKDQDLLYGDAGDDIVYGNLGNDTCYGGDGADWVRGGQGDDIIDGGTGNDWMAGDRGNDTVTGGAGADRFYFFAGAAIDRVTDFSSAAGDRVLLDVGQTYTLSYTSEGAVIDLGNGDQLILLGVTQATIGDWLVY